MSPRGANERRRPTPSYRAPPASLNQQSDASARRERDYSSLSHPPRAAGATRGEVIMGVLSAAVDHQNPLPGDETINLENDSSDNMWKKILPLSLHTPGVL